MGVDHGSARGTSRGEIVAGGSRQFGEVRFRARMPFPLGNHEHLKGTDATRKMSPSLVNHIELAEHPKDGERVMSIVTDFHARSPNPTPAAPRSARP